MRKNLYIAMRLVRESETSMGLPIIIEDETCAGCLFVFKTKTAARKVYGRSVLLLEIDNPAAQGEQG